MSFTCRSRVEPFILTGRSLSQYLPLPPAGFDALSVEEQIDYVQSLWDHIAANPEQVPLPDWHKEIIAERLAAYRENPSEGKPWEEVETEIKEELKRRPE